MPERNRVTPYGEIIVANERGMFMGNRGCLHRGHDIVRPWNGKRWITCVLEFRGRRAPRWEPGRYTALFFYDEAVAFAAGHRPCAECRHADYERYRDAWESASGKRLSADDMDARLHDDRLAGRDEAVAREALARSAERDVRRCRRLACARHGRRVAPLGTRDRLPRACAPPNDGNGDRHHAGQQCRRPARRIRRRRQPCGICDMNWFRSK